MSRELPSSFSRSAVCERSAGRACRVRVGSRRRALLPVVVTCCLCLQRAPLCVLCGVMDDTRSHCAITRWCTIVFLSHFLRGSRSSCVSEPKTTEIIICVMYDVFFSEDKSPDDLGCLANVAAAALVLPFCLAPPPHRWIPDMAPSWTADDAAAFSSSFTPDRPRIQIPRLLRCRT